MLRYLGTITADNTTAKTNGTTSTPFKNTEPATLAGLPLVVQPSAQCYVKGVGTSSGAVSATDGVKLDVDGLYDCPMDATEKFLSVLGVSGTVNLKVFVGTMVRR